MAQAAQGKANGIGKNLGITVLVIVLIGAAAMAYYSTRSPIASTNGRPFIDSTTGTMFRHDLRAGETLPIEAPSGGKTGWPAEMCYWTSDGHVKSTPTYVLLNSYVGKPGPTFCPDCGRLVVPRNPPAVQGMRPPPTKQEYEMMHSINAQPDSRDDR